MISRNPDIEGHADNSDSKRMDSFDTIIGNPAEHFTEDTFSGLTSSPSRLEEQDGVLVLTFIENAFEPQELLKMQVCDSGNY